MELHVKENRLVELTPVRTEKILDIVTGKIKEVILGGKYKPGDRLPSEREFIEQLQVSRIVIREAFRKLEANGLLTAKRGAGMFVANTGSGAVHDAFVSALRIQKVNLKEITQARWVIEPVITKLAAKNRAVDNIKSLKANVEKAQDLLKKNISAHHENMDFHGLVAEATQNRVLRLSVEALIHSLRDVQGLPENQLVLDNHALFWHKEILKAIEERKPKKAADLMSEHIGEVREDYVSLVGLQ